MFCVRGLLRWGKRCKKRIGSHVPFVVVGRVSESVNVALRVRYEGSCVTRFFKWCVGVINGKLEKGFFAEGLLGNELSFLVEGLNEVLSIGC